MFLCGNFCNNQGDEPEIIINTSESFVNNDVLDKTGDTFQKTLSSLLTIKASKYNQHLNRCMSRKQKFTDDEFPPNEKSLNFNSKGRQITWKRIGEIVNKCVLFNQINPQDVQQGNLGDCYFLACLSALAQVPSRIKNIFFKSSTVNPYGIYKVIVNVGGSPREFIIDDYIPVYADTDRPVFCKANDKQVWVILLQKVWAKIKGSYGNIAQGCPHQVLNTFSISPCEYMYIHSQIESNVKNSIWQELIHCSQKNFPVVAGTKFQITINGLQPQHTYTVLNCKNIKLQGRTEKLMLLRNPWGYTQYTGFASESDTKFWSQVTQDQKRNFLPDNSNDGQFIIPFSQFLNNFQSLDICMSEFGFSYHYNELKMKAGEPQLYRLTVKQPMEAYITIEKEYQNQSKKNNRDVNHGYTRIVLAHQLAPDVYEYYDSKLQTNFPDVTLRCPNLKPGQYVVYVQGDLPVNQYNFNASLSFYHTNFTNASSASTLQKPFTQLVSYNRSKAYIFLQQVFKNHGYVHSEPGERSRISNKIDDWIATKFMYDEGGFGYVLCSLGKTSAAKLSISIDTEVIQANGFTLLKQGKNIREQVLMPGNVEIFVFSYRFGRVSDLSNVNFPPAGFKIMKIV